MDLFPMGIWFNSENVLGWLLESWLINLADSYLQELNFCDFKGDWSSSVSLLGE